MFFGNTTQTVMLKWYMFESLPQTASNGQSNSKSFLKQTNVCFKVKALVLFLLELRKPDHPSITHFIFQFTQN